MLLSKFNVKQHYVDLFIEDELFLNFPPFQGLDDVCVYILGGIQAQRL